MTEPITPLISLLGAPGAACEGDDCLPGQDLGEPGETRPEADQPQADPAAIS